jgi:hypothetical protein
VVHQDEVMLNKSPSRLFTYLFLGTATAWTLLCYWMGSFLAWAGTDGHGPPEWRRKRLVELVAILSLVALVAYGGLQRWPWWGIRLLIGLTIGAWWYWWLLFDGAIQGW